MSDIAAITDTMQAMSLVGFIIATVLAIAGWKRITDAGRFFALAALSYTIPGIAFYALVVFFPEAPGNGVRTMLSVVLRWDSLILVTVGIWLAIRSSRRVG